MVLSPLDCYTSELITEDLMLNYTVQRLIRCLAMHIAFLWPSIRPLQIHDHLGQIMSGQNLTMAGQGGVTPIGAVSRAATGVKIFDHRKTALTA